MSGPSGTESDETRSGRGLGATTGETGVSGSPLEAVAQALRENRPSGGTIMHPGDWQEWVAETAAEIVTVLELREETTTFLHPDNWPKSADPDTWPMVRRLVTPWQPIGEEQTSE